MDFSFIKLPKSVGMRRPYPGELEYFRSNPRVSGMATEDGRVILNPFSDLSPQEFQAVAVNEAARLLMRKDRSLSPDFELTPEQKKMLEGTSYINTDDIDRKATIAARIFSGDPSGGIPTEQQKQFIERLRKRLMED